MRKKGKEREILVATEGGESEHPTPSILFFSHLTPSHFSSKDLNIHFIKENAQITIKCIQRCSVILNMLKYILDIIKHGESFLKKMYLM